jgi:uracil-DNA glycosylase family 4
MKFKPIDPEEIDKIPDVAIPEFEPVTVSEEAEYIEPKAPQANCTECPLARQPIVYGDGPDKAKLVLVGEAPGRNEVRTGVPFIGKAGQLLNKVLAAHGIDRNDVYVTNGVLCWPGPKTPDGKGNATPSSKAIACCRPRLVAEIKAHKPDKVLAMGAVAAKSVLNTKESMNVLRLGGGKYSEELGALAVATYHPAAAFYNPDVFPSIVEDVKKLASGQIKVKWEPTKHEVADNIGDGLRLLGVQGGFPRLALDIETGKPYNRHNPRILCVGVSHKPGYAVVYDSTVSNDPRFKNLLNDAFAGKAEWVMQNGKEVDVQNLWGNGVTNAHVDFDTMLAHYATDERKGTHALEQLGTSILGAPRWKQEAKSEEDDLEFLPREKLHYYNAQDADITNRLVEPLSDMMEADGTRWTFDNLLMPGAMALANMEYEGVTVDMNTLVEMDAELTERMEAAEEELSKWVDNPRSPPQIKRALLDLDFQVDNTTAATLKGIDHEFATKLLAYKKDQKLRSTYVRGLVKHICSCGRVHSDFLLHGTETGRTSSARPNLQNQPPRTRPLFTASSPDNVLVNFDYSAIELRVAAVLMRDPYFLEVLRDPTRHIHKEEAIRLYGDDYTHEQYVRTKGVNFGIIYDRQPKAIAHEWVNELGMKLGPAIKEATATVNGWKERSPAIWEFHAMVREAIDTVGYLRSPFGNVRRFWFITEDNKSDLYREGYNFPMQCVGGYITLYALIRLVPGLKAQGFKTKAVITVHDSIIFDMPRSEMNEAIPYIQSVMEDVPMDMPFPTEYKYAHEWLEEK